MRAVSSSDRNFMIASGLVLAGGLALRSTASGRAGKIAGTSTATVAGLAFAYVTAATQGWLGPLVHGN